MSGGDKKVSAAKTAATSTTSSCSTATATADSDKKLPPSSEVTSPSSEEPTTTTTTSSTRVEQEAYQQTHALLTAPAFFLAPFPSVVSLRDLVQEPLPASTTTSTGSTSATSASRPHNNNHHHHHHHHHHSPLAAAAAAVADPFLGAAFAAAAFAGSSMTGTATGTTASELSLLLEETPTSLLSPNKGHHALFRSLEELEGLEKEEVTLLEHSPLTAPLTQVVVTGHIVTQDDDDDDDDEEDDDEDLYQPHNQHQYHLSSSSTTRTTRATTPTTARAALDQLRELVSAIPRRVCQHPFKRNDIVWVCRTCQADETCVLCHNCFSQSNHQGHDVAFYHAQAGGCCDCGDPDAWSPAGFCPYHGPPSCRRKGGDDLSPLTPAQVKRVRGVVPSVVDWMVHEIAHNAQAGYQRAMVVRRSSLSRQKQRRQRRRQRRRRQQQQQSETNILTTTTTASMDISIEQIGAAIISGEDPLMMVENDNDDIDIDIDHDSDSDDDDDDAFDDDVFDDDDDAGEYQHDVWDYNSDLETSNNSNSNNITTTTTTTTTSDGVFNAAAASGTTTTTTTTTTRGPHFATTAALATAIPTRLQQLQQLQPWPAAASTTTNSNSNHAYATTNNRPSVTNFAHKIGTMGREGHGLYLVLFADDIHTPTQWIDALREFLGASSYYTDSLLAKFVRALRQYGQLVVWGTMELVAECGTTNANLWLDGDFTATTLIANALLKRAKKLLAHGFFCSIVTRQELQLEQRAVAVLQWMSALARSCDPLCQTVAECILPNRHLVPLLRADFKLSARITKAWYSLLLTLLAVPTFKSHLAAAYCDTYRSVTAKYSAGMGLLERSAYTLSVQFLNRVTYVVDLVQGRDLLGKLGKSLLETLKVARMKTTSLPPEPQDERRRLHHQQQQQSQLLQQQLQQQQGQLNPNHFVLSHRRYSPCISDLKCVLNVKGMKRLFACQEGTFLQDWVLTLSLAQFMDAQVWRHWTQGHVEDEARGWVGAFNLSISLGSLFERLLSWEDEEPSPIKDPSSPLSRNLLSCKQLTYHILMSGIAKWQLTATQSCVPTPNTTGIDPHKRCPASLPFSTIAAKQGCALAFEELPIAQVSPFSFHLPLHRFLAACLREGCLRKQKGVEDLLQMISSNLPDREVDRLFRGLMEYPILVLTRASQVRAGLWRRNGPGLNDQVLNYAEPPFCRSMRDADLLLIQFATLKRTMHQCPHRRPDSDVGISFLVHLLLHRLGIFDSAGLTKAPDSDPDRYLAEVAQQLYPRELRPDTALIDDDTIVLPWTYSPARDAQTRLVLLEEFLYLMVVFIVELPPLPPRDKEDHTHQAKDRLRREVIHRLASGPKTHSELSEVHLVLSHWDNVFLSEEGKLVNPDDATGAALGAVLEEVADRKSSRGKLEPDKWELRRSAWEAYDPSFFHISLRSHQTAAESRPRPQTKGKNSTEFLFGVEAKSYGPVTPPAHPVFERLRRDVSADATILAIAYRILHLHCRDAKQKDVAGHRGGKFAYENEERSETALARAVHILTLGAFAWQHAGRDDPDWRTHGGGSAGSVFFDKPDKTGSPSVSDWVAAALLSDPAHLLDCDWYEGEEKAIVLLRRLAVDGGIPGSFVAGDRSVRAGAAWLCEFALNHCAAAASHLGTNAAASATAGGKSEPSETELQKKKRLAKEKALARMKDQAAKFASMMKVELEEGEEDKDNSTNALSSNNISFSSTWSGSAMQLSDTGETTPHHPQHQNPPVRSSSLGSTHSLSSTSVETNGAESEWSFTHLLTVSAAALQDHSTADGGYEDSLIPNRLLKVRPQCIICNDESTSDSRARPSYEEEGQHKRSRRRKLDGGNALGFVGYAQASTVMKGGGGPPCADDSMMSPVRRFVGAHVALCGHAVHSECCEAYLAIVSHKEDRVIGKRDEFRCPLCQRLSNCLVPFIDVGEDWICPPTSFKNDGQAEDQAIANKKSDTDVDMMSNKNSGVAASFVSLREFLSVTPWWVSRHNPHVVWDGQSAFVSKSFPAPANDSGGDRSISGQSDSAVSTPSKPRRRSVRSLRKKDLYAAWNAMMRTPRFVRRRFRHRGNEEAASPSSRGGHEVVQTYASDQEETTGETVVWRRFMDQVCDVAYRADSKRLGEETLHSYFGEFRHYIVEKFTYNLAKRSAGIDPTDWPSCVFSTTLSDTQRQELSREKLLSKLLMTIQAFTYSCCCEASEARRGVRKHIMSSREVAGISETSGIDAVCSKFGISGVLCDGKVILMPYPSSTVDDGAQPFNGRIGRLRYLALAVMAAAGAVAADLVQLVLSFPQAGAVDITPDEQGMDIEKPDRAPIAFPILLGNVLTHVVAAMSATCGRARARSDSLELVWPVPFSIRGSFAFSDGGSGTKRVDSVIEDCEGFVKLGLLARILQVLLGALEVPACNLEHAVSTVAILRKGIQNNRDDSSMSTLERSWVLSCFSLLEAALSDQEIPEKQDLGAAASSQTTATMELFNEACVVAAGSACSFLVDISTILQVLIPGVMARYDCQSAQMASSDWERDMSLRTFEKLRALLEIESLEEMLRSPSVREIVSNWYNAAYEHSKAAAIKTATTTPSLPMLNLGSSIRHRLYRTQGFRAFDWPMQSSPEWMDHSGKPSSSRHAKMMSFKMTEPEPQHEGNASSMQLESMPPDETPGAEMLRQQVPPPLVTFTAKKTVPLIGGFRYEGQSKINTRPRVAVVPTSYTDLYAELGALLPDCEQTAVCLICGEVLNAGGKSECTRHSYKCGAGSGLFFLLQECSGLIMHKGKAAYIHSPYVDSHGETPQYRGRPLNLDLARYDHLREVWKGHGVRQQVLAERGSSRQVIVPDFY